MTNTVTLSALEQCLEVIKDQERESSFILPDQIDFGFHSVTGGNAILRKNSLQAGRWDPDNLPDDAIVYGSLPLTGTAEFEVEIVKYVNRVWGSTLRIGIMWYKSGSRIVQSKIPKESERAADHCVWWDTRVYNRFGGNIDTRRYGLIDLYNLDEGDRVGMRLTPNGDLVFLVNGQRQGIAALDVHKEGYDVYPVVDVSTRCYEVRITRAVMCFQSSLQELCIDRISRSLQSFKDVQHLPLPEKLCFSIQLDIFKRTIHNIRAY